MYIYSHPLLPFYEIETRKHYEQIVVLFLYQYQNLAFIFIYNF